jgi:2-dehydro-3-deoxygluconokinase
LPLVDLIFPNQAEAEHLTGSNDIREAARTLLRYGIETVALKSGKRGCTVGSVGGIFSAPTFAVEVQDTTGAGDSFDAGFILGRLWGLGARQSALLANALGALAASAVGAGDALPGKEKARALLQRCLSDPGWQDWTGEIGRILSYL